MEKMLVRNAEVRGGGYFLVKSVLNPTFQDGKDTGRSGSGTLNHNLSDKRASSSRAR